MANEISFTPRLILENGLLKDDFNPGRIQVTQTAQGQFNNVLSIGTTEESVTLTDIGTVGIAYLYNLDSTNYVEVGFSTGVYGIRLKAGDIPAIFRMNPGATLYLKANTAACKVQICVKEN